jgi:uncharacterized protein YdaU (DUF1376 family)
MSDPKPLQWFPVYRADWMNSSAVAAMLPEQEGAFWRLLVTSWGDGDSEPSLPADDAQLAVLSKLGARWKKLGAPVRAMFVVRDLRLYNTKLSEVWREQSAKHTAASEKASKAALARADKRRSETASGASPSTARSSAPGTRQASSLSREKLEGTAPDSTPKGVESQEHVPPVDALAPAGAAPRAAGAGSGDYLDSPGAQEEFLRRGLRRDTDASRPPLALDGEADNARRNEHSSRVRARAEQWIAKHPDELPALEAEVRSFLGFRVSGELTPAMQRIQHEQVVEVIRTRRGWPTYDEWAELQDAAEATA